MILKTTYLAELKKKKVYKNVYEEGLKKKGLVISLISSLALDILKCLTANLKQFYKIKKIKEALFFLLGESQAGLKSQGELFRKCQVPWLNSL